MALVSRCMAFQETHGSFAEKRSIFVCVHIYIYIYSYVCVHINIYVYMYICTYIYINIYICIC